MSEIDHSDPSNSAVKPGWKSTEAWITLVVTVLGALMASGLLDPSDPAQAKITKIVGLVLSVASVLGYQAGRTYVKSISSRVAGEVAIAQASRVPGLDREAR